MASLNKCILIGNVTRDIELRYISSGQAVAEISLAVNDNHKDKNGKTVESAVFVECTVWGKQAETASEYLEKGSPVLIEGRLTLDTWEDKQSGQKRSKLKVTCERLQLLPGGSGRSTTHASNAQPAQDNSTVDQQQCNGDDVPF